MNKKETWWVRIKKWVVTYWYKTFIPDLMKKKKWVTTHPMITVVSILALCGFGWILIETYRRDYLGFDKELWEWMGLLIIPLLLAGGGLWFTHSQKKNDIDIAAKENETDRDIALERQRQATLENYFDRMSALILENDLVKTEDENVINIARARTHNILLNELQSERNRQVITFLSKASLLNLLEDLSGVDLSGASLRDLNLNGAYLNGANLSGADLSESDLNGARLRKADLSKAVLFQADLSKADLFGADLSGAGLFGADLSGAGLWEANLRKADLVIVDLSGAYLTGANLSEAKLYNEDLKGSNLSGAYLNGADLRGADLRRAVLSGADLSDADLSGADLSGANLSGANLSGANLSGANLSDASLFLTITDVHTKFPEGFQKPTPMIMIDVDKKSAAVE